MPHTTEVSKANKSKLIVTTGFKSYDYCMNPYVGCQYGCAYCYVQFFVKDKDHQWGEFVRTRDYLIQKLPRELGSIVDNSRLVIGTMTDPFQPIERKNRLTHSALQILTDPQYYYNEKPRFRKVGIFTRSPIVLDSIDLIKQLPNPVIHFTITPYPPEMMRKIEPYSTMTKTRWKIVREIKQSGIRTHVNVAPLLPELSEEFIEPFIDQLTDIGVDEYFVDPMQAYPQAIQHLQKNIGDTKEWPKILEIISDKKEYEVWKQAYHTAWDQTRERYQHRAPNQLPIWSDHQNHVWFNMKTKQQMNPKTYHETN